jgi:hypothetical protein
MIDRSEFAKCNLYNIPTCHLAREMLLEMLHLVAM